MSKSNEIKNKHSNGKTTDSRPIVKSNKNKSLSAKESILGPGTIQEELFHVEKQAEVNGVEMGVLENGVPYLTETGLARMCGIDRKVLNRLAINWSEEKTKPRGRQILNLLEQSSYHEDVLFLKSEHKNTEVNAYTEPVCLALLEYYAFLADEKREEAIRAFRSLARVTFRTFIYQSVGYSPEQKILYSWKHFHDRVDMTLDSVPDGFFSVFIEISSMIVPMIRSGIMISDKVVPDISVGKAWSEFWKENNLSEEYGNRTKYDHDYPLYYPQSKSNPQPAYAYPDDALGIFRAWLKRNYIANKFPKYLVGQIKLGKLDATIAHKAIESFAPKEIEHQK